MTVHALGHLIIYLLLVVVVAVASEVIGRKRAQVAELEARLTSLEDALVTASGPAEDYGKRGVDETALRFHRCVARRLLIIETAIGHGPLVRSQREIIAREEEACSR